MSARKAFPIPIAAFVGALVLMLSACTEQDKETNTMNTSDMVFVGFPHQGKIVDLSAYDDRDETAAKEYYRELFVGKELKDVEETCRLERERLERGEHDAETITCRPVEPDQFRIAYRFALQTPDTETPMAALVWDVRLTLAGDRVTDVEAAANILAP